MKTVVTIARNYGSGGKEIGKALAKALGVNYYGREIFEISQGEDPIPYKSGDESIHEASTEETKELFRRQAEAIRTIAERESCVIVGRCADYVLRDMENVVRVYLYAPQRDCMRRVIRLYELNPDEAKSLIHSMNKSRGDYYEYNTGQKWSDPTHYDLCLNTAELGTDRCVEIIKGYMDVRFKETPINYCAQ